MNKILIFTALFTFGTMVGCSTMPEKIEPSLLLEAAADQNTQIQQLNRQIISKREESLALQKAVSIAEAVIAVSSEQVRLYEQNGKLLNAQFSLYTVQSVKEKMDIASKSIEANRKHIVQEKANGEYCAVYRDQLTAEKELREQELAVLLSQLDLLKAKIASEYQVKHQEKKPIIVEPYQKYNEDMVRQLSGKQAELKIAAEKTGRSKDALVKTGYGEQP